MPELARTTFVPRASSSGVDARGRGINDLEQKLMQMPEAVRPARVVTVMLCNPTPQILTHAAVYGIVIM